MHRPDGGRQGHGEALVMWRALLSGAALVLLAMPAWADSSFPPPPAPSSADLVAVLGGRAWSVSTGIVTVPANDELDVVLMNPAGSGCTATFTLRRFSNPNSVGLAFQSFANPSPLPGGVTASPGNRRIGDASASGLSFSYMAQAQGAMTGTPGVKAPLLVNSENDITVNSVLLPGRSYGIAITALSGLLGSALPVAVTLVGYCA